MKILIFSLLLFVQSAHAEIKELTPGMSFADVIAIKGPPLEKDDHEVSRVAIWRYKEGSLRFLNGRLQMATTVSAPVSDRPTPQRKKVAKKNGARKSDISQNVVDEIIDELPNEATGPQPSSPGAAPGNANPFMSAP